MKRPPNYFSKCNKQFNDEVILFKIRNKIELSAMTTIIYIDLEEILANMTR